MGQALPGVWPVVLCRQRRLGVRAGSTWWVAGSWRCRESSSGRLKADGAGGPDRRGAGAPGHC